MYEVKENGKSRVLVIDELTDEFKVE